MNDMNDTNDTNKWKQFRVKGHRVYYVGGVFTLNPVHAEFLAAINYFVPFVFFHQSINDYVLAGFLDASNTTRTFTYLASLTSAYEIGLNFPHLMDFFACFNKCFPKCHAGLTISVRSSKHVVTLLLRHEDQQAISKWLSIGFDFRYGYCDYAPVLCQISASLRTPVNDSNKAFAPMVEQKES